MRPSVAIAVLLTAPAARAECAHFDLFPAVGVDLTLVTDVRQRLESAGLASSGELDDCPVRLSISEQEIVVDVELEDRIVTRAFPKNPPREAAWSIAVLLEELAPADPERPRGTVEPPEEIVPTVGPPEPQPDLRPDVRTERPARPRRSPYGIWIALGPRLVGPLRGEGERAAVSLQVALLPTRLTLVASVDAYFPASAQGDVSTSGAAPERATVTFWSVQPGIGAGYEILRRGDIAASAQALALWRFVSVEPDPGPKKLSVTRFLGVTVRGRVEMRLLGWLGAGVALHASYLPIQNLTNSGDLETAPWELGGGIDGVFHP